MAERLDIQDIALSAWLDALAAGTPTPGGGAAAAVAAAMAAALVAMTCKITVNTAARAEFHASMADGAGRAERLRAEALTLAAQDSAAFDRVILATRRPKTDAARREAIEEALFGASDVPLRVARIGAELIALAGDIRSGVNPGALADVDAAIGLARAALQISIANVVSNLASFADQERSQTMMAEAEEHGRALLDAATLTGDALERLPS
jgi:formiminotetrahydrofolate cyclodeaminase